ncbi:MAG: zinc-ribbon domain-containing protein [Eubacteriales bacterium]|nr:zinc-ribbon domain-containing protein [Eubacteriales bacterium]
MFCAKCGASLKDDAMQCDKCGAPVRIRPAAETREEEFSAFSVPDEKALESRLPDAKDRNGRKHKKKKGRSGSEDTFRDPVYYEDVTDELDVGEILRIVRGQEGSAEAGADSSYETGEDDFDSEDRYGGDLDDLEDVPLPLMERIRRRLAEAHHVRAEADDEKAMARHLARAEKYYDLQESMADQLRRERARKAEELRLRRIRQDEEWHEQKWFEEALRKELEEERAAQRAQENRLEEERKARIEENARIEQERKVREEENARLEQERKAARAEESARLEEEKKAYSSGTRAYAGQTETVSAGEEAYLRKVRAARARRRAQEDAQDGFDRFLGKYGLTKEIAVRIATLFLIALLSMIYVLGRGGSTANAGSLPADGMTGVPALAEPDAEGGEAEEESAVPTGGGDFQNTQQ